MVDWITISSNSGNSGTTVITVTAATYDELTARTTSLVVNTVYTSLSGSVSISQEPRAVETVSVSPSTISVPKEGGTYTFNIISNGAWTISYPDEWMNLSQSAGTGNATITVDVAQNLILSGKTGNIEVSTRDNTAIVQVSQERNTGYINVEPSVLEFVYSGGSRAVIVGSNTDWTISNVPNWVSASTLSGTGNNVVTFTISDTPSSDRNVAIKFSVLDEDAYLTIRQSSTIPYLYFENSAITFDNAGGTQINRVNSNVQWEVLPNLTFEIISGGTVTWTSTWSYDIIYCSKNGNDYLSGSSISVQVNTGDILDFYGNNQAGGSFSGTTAVFKAKGNIMSIVNTTPDYLRNLFKSCTGLTDASELILPLSSLPNNYYYANMFEGCTSLTTAPSLPATTLSNNCYESMFAGCTSLTTAPSILPAPTINQECYLSMFDNCTSLTTAPVLPAKNLYYRCYKNMFRNCSSLTYIKCLAERGINGDSTYDWVSLNVPNTSDCIFVKSPNANVGNVNNTTYWKRGVSGILSNWTIIDGI